MIDAVDWISFSPRDGLFGTITAMHEEWQRPAWMRKVAGWFR